MVAILPPNIYPPFLVQVDHALDNKISIKLGGKRSIFNIPHKLLLCELYEYNKNTVFSMDIRKEKKNR